MASVAVNFWVGKKLAHKTEGKARPWLFGGILFNLGLLAYFKYTGFFIEGLNSLGLWLIPVPEITLPLAISFFTFQQIAYIVDVSRKDCQEYQFHHYALFVLFFPQLIAGPIVHHKEMMPQFNTLRPRAQIPTDFAVGLTFIAIGSARLFGITLPENFRSPYKSRSIIGSSRSGTIRPEHSQWQELKGYNFSVPGLTLYEMNRSVRHAHARQPLEKLMIDLDYQAMVSPLPRTRKGFKASRLVTNSAGFSSVPYLRQRLSDLQVSLFSLDVAA